MPSAPGRLWAELFPLSSDADPARYAAEAVAQPAFAANTAALQARIPSLPRAQAELIQDYAKDRLASEQSRADSVTSRAQALLVAQAFLGALLSLGGTIIGHLDAFRGWRGGLLTLVALYLVIQTVLLTLSALRTIRGLSFPAIGSSDLLDMLPGGGDQIVRQMALQTLLHYRSAANLNTWRFRQLGNAQTALRNTAVALAALVVLTFCFSVLFPPAEPPPAPLVVRLPASEFAPARVLPDAAPFPAAGPAGLSR